MANDVDNNHSPEYSIFVGSLLAGINDRFRHLESDETYILSTALDPRYKLRTFSLQTTVIEAKKILISKIAKNNRDNVPEQREPLKHEVKLFTGIWSACSTLIRDAEEEEPLSNISTCNEQQEVESYIRCPNISLKEDPKNYWRNENKYPNLKKLAQKYLSYQLSSVASERLFSTAWLIQNDLRNRLSANNLKILCFLNKNLPKVNFNYC
nr:unnamed protein product [Callosobruchus analis]